MDVFYTAVVSFGNSFPSHSQVFLNIYEIASMNYTKANDVAMMLMKLCEAKNLSNPLFNDFKMEFGDLVENTHSIIDDCMVIANNLFSIAGGYYNNLELVS